MGAKEILPCEEPECWGQPWMHGRAWGAQESLGCREAPWGGGESLGCRGAPQGTGHPVPDAWES